MKTCIACGMPMKKLSDYPKNNEDLDYCIHCAKEDGSIQSFDEIKEKLTNFIIKSQNLNKEDASKIVENQMKKLPAWKTYFK
ncbi:zinc ribbon domain-containing protein [Methanobrevibacter filiformis]|uniref:Putative zinc ribbon domain protein n=1 Tax=Methanobrevibacter filiformis TaxID=55758 RepID=A0A165ZG07_9EURY|nr:zinc ribbon domain-containing protein [Methanobrevibacter filiformis]KZX10662.1 putative zinc ribbon domain protein [Methanobrevibacter filiformis]